MKLHRVSRVTLGAASLAILRGSALFGQGFGLNEIGACALARGFANTAASCKDPSLVFWNPGAATTLSGWTASAGIAAISLSGDFKQDTTRARFESDAPTSWVPSVFVNYHKDKSKAAWGLGVYVPYGLTSQWGQDFPGRFVAQKASLQTVYIQPNFAWQINSNWSVGGGPIIGTSHVELRQSLDLSPLTASAGPPPTTFAQLGIPLMTEFARAKITGSATGFGGQIGVLGRLSPTWMVGARFMLPITFNYDDANATFTQVPTNLVLGGTLLPPFFVAGAKIDQLVAPQFATGGALVAQKATTKITHPAQGNLGVGYSGFKNLDLSVDYAWVGWNRFKSLPLRFPNATDTTLNKNFIEDYNNTSAIRVGAEYKVSEFKIRAGFQGVASAAPAETVTPLLPEQDRQYFTLGGNWAFAKRYSVDASYAHIYTPGARGRIVDRASEAQTAAQLNTGVFGLKANIFALTLNASF